MGTMILFNHNLFQSLKGCTFFEQVIECRLDTVLTHTGVQNNPRLESQSKGPRRRRYPISSQSLIFKAISNHSNFISYSSDSFFSNNWLVPRGISHVFINNTFNITFRTFLYSSNFCATLSFLDSCSKLPFKNKFPSYSFNHCLIRDTGLVFSLSYSQVTLQLLFLFYVWIYLTPVTYFTLLHISSLCLPS